MIGDWFLVLGCWLLVVGRWLLVVVNWLLVVGCWLLVVGCFLFIYPGSENRQPLYFRELKIIVHACRTPCSNACVELGLV